MGTGQADDVHRSQRFRSLRISLEHCKLKKTDYLSRCPRASSRYPPGLDTETKPGSRSDHFAPISFFFAVSVMRPFCMNVRKDPRQSGPMAVFDEISRT